MKQAVRRILTDKYFLIPNAEKLTLLAEDRAREIVKELEAVGGIPSDRLVLKSPEPQTSGPPSASFFLDALTASR